MKITKLGHCCLVLDIDGREILTDPGAYSSLQNEVKGISLILITHEHPDHYHVESVKTVLSNNPGAAIVTNKGVGTLLEKEGIPFTLVGDKEMTTLGAVTVEGIGCDHEEIFETFGLVENTGYFVNNAFFYPGDAFTNPGKPVDILALPISGPF